jgi:hypothetical protein
MIIINKSGFLKYKNLKFRCAFGKNGIGKKKIEGDNITPRGNYKIIRIYYRKDRVKKISSKFKLISIKKNMGWCDDQRSKKYNQLIKLPNIYKHEILFRRDNIYDLFIYHLNVSECIWYIIHELIFQKKIRKEHYTLLMKKLFSFFQYYNNNYRPIYHLENILYYIITLIHGY